MSAQLSRGANDAGWGNGLCWAPRSGGGSVGGAPYPCPQSGGRKIFRELMK